MTNVSYWQILILFVADKRLSRATPKITLIFEQIDPASIGEKQRKKKKYYKESVNEDERLMYHVSLPFSLSILFYSRTTVIKSTMKRNASHL